MLEKRGDLAGRESVTFSLLPLKKAGKLAFLSSFRERIKVLLRL